MILLRMEGMVGNVVVVGVGVGVGMEEEEGQVGHASPGQKGQ